MYFADICEPGWTYFNGFCYLTSKTCQNWTIARHNCRQENSVLVDVQNNEGNVFLQHLHNGEKSWLDSMTFSQRVPLLGQMVAPGTLQLGPETNQTILGMKTV